MPPLPGKLTDKEKTEVAERYVLGETYDVLAKEFNVSSATIRKAIVKSGKQRPPKDPVAATSITEFTKRARSILWRQETGKVKKSYDSWQKMVDDYVANSGMTRHQAVVQASKDFPCLARLFREYSIGANDPHPDSHPGIHHFGQPAPTGSIENEGKEQSHRRNLAWAIEAAGKFSRTGVEPTIAPNDAAFWLYRQAVDDPKGFLAKYSQAEAKGDDELERKQRARKTGQRAIDEIDEMLAELNDDSGGIPPYTGKLKES